MGYIVFQSHIELNQHTRTKLREVLGEPYSNEILQDISDAVTVKKEDILKVLNEDILVENTRVTLPLLYFFYKPLEVCEMLQTIFPRLSANLKHYKDLEIIKYPRKISQPIHSEIMAHVFLLKSVSINDLYEKFGKLMTESAIQTLIESKMMYQEGDLIIADERPKLWPSADSIIAMMRADLDAFPISINNKFAKYFGMRRESTNINEHTLPLVNELIIKFQENVSKLLQQDKSEANDKNVQLNFNCFYYVRSAESKLLPIYRAEEEQINSMIKVTQMFAHDVRKPFTLIQSLLQILEDSKNIDQLKDILLKYHSEVEKSFNSVNDMIKDILAMGKEIKYDLSSLDPEIVIKNALQDTFVFHTSCDIHLSFNLQHRHFIYGDTSRLNRVLSNILTNALQAMNFKGEIWISTKTIMKDNRPYIQFCIGNNNSFIPASSLQRLFEPFYTINKKNGTGLGLAIVHKIIDGHGGEIWCQSIENFGVEFYFTLPCTAEILMPKIDFPKHSSLYFSSPEICNPNKIKTMNCETQKVEKSPFQIAVLDDSVIVLEAWKRKMPNAFIYNSPESFFVDLKDRKVDLDKLDAIVTDFYFDDCHSLFTGLELAAKVKSINNKIPIFLASNCDKETEELKKNNYFSEFISKNPAVSYQILANRFNSFQSSHKASHHD